MRRRGKMRFVWRVLLGLAGVAVVALVALHLALPRLLEAAVRRGGAKLGFEEAALDVTRADLGGLRAQTLHVRRGGLDVALERAAVDFSVLRLLAGQIARAEVDGLTVALDFTRPRRALLPDAVTDLLGLFGGGGELVWPADELEFKNCRLLLVLPQGTVTLALAATARRQADGRVAFEAQIDHPDLHARARGTIRTETMTGDVDLERLSVQPGFALRLARQLGLFELPAGTTLATESVELSGNAALADSALKTFAAKINVAAARYEQAALVASIENLAIEAAQDSAGKLTASLHARASATGNSAPWSAGPAQVDLSLADGHVQGTVASLTARWQETATARVALTVDAGLPTLGGPTHAQLDVRIEEAGLAGVKLAPATISVGGWLDRVTVTATELALASDSPAAVNDLAITLTNATGPNRAIEATAKIIGQPAALKALGALPGGWQVSEPALPAEVVELNARGAWSDGVPNLNLRLVSRVPKLQLTNGAESFACAPSLDATVTFDARGLAATASLQANDIASNAAIFPPGIRAMSAGLELAPTSLAAISELAAQRVPPEDLALTVKGSVRRSETGGDGYIALRHFGKSAESSAEAWLMLDNLNGAWAGANVRGMRVEVTVDSGRAADAQVREWLASPPQPGPLVRELLPRAAVYVSLAAEAIDAGAGARSEWTGFWLKKPAATPDKPQLAATLSAYTGILRAGPETIEQPWLEMNLSGGLETCDADLKARALLEGAPVELQLAQRITMDWPTLTAAGAGPFALQPFTLTQSDLVSRWAPSAAGVAVTATLGASGTLTWKSSGEWDGTASVTLANGGMSYPPQALRLEGLNTTVELTSLKNVQTAKDQPLRFGRLAIGDFEVTNGMARFATDGPERLLVSGANARIFGGDVAVGSFMLLFPDPDVGVVVEFEGLDAGQLVRQLEIFQGTLTGKLRGRLPVGLLAGRPIVGEGFLELDPRYPSTFSMDASGIFTADLPGKTTKDKVVRLPYELLEEALGNLTIRQLRVDLFQRDRPETPIRVEFSGESVTPRARVPLNIVTNINGSVAEALNFFLRLAML